MKRLWLWFGLLCAGCANAQSLPTWSSSFTYQGTSYPYTMVGTDPNLSGSHTTTVSVLMIPLILTFSDGTVFDPTVANSAGFAPVQKVILSPLFSSTTFKAGGVNLGDTQYPDAFQRANFWNHIDANHDFHVKLSSPPPVIYGQHLTVPSADGYTTTDSSGAKKGHIDFAWIQPMAHSLLTTYSLPNQLTIFLLYNVSTYNFLNHGPSDVVGGFHLSYTTALGPTTYIVSNFTDNKDVATLGHEVGEWLDDPFANTHVPAWTGGTAGTGCSSFLEVGDPINGQNFTVSLNGLTFHLPDLVFLSWFARRSPSTSVNQWYTFRNGFSAPQPVCLTGAPTGN